MVEANMHPDKKTGLALGVLLVGFVGAFFFRNEADPNNNIPELENAQALDDRIAERPVVPYLTGVETEQDDPADPRSNGLSDQELPSFLRQDDQDGFGSPPEPIREQGIASDFNSGRDSTTTASHNDAWQTSPRNNNRSERSYVDGPRFHVVQKGDTLTALAAKYLGSTRRFGDLYNANRDLLKSADDLRVGMKLRIPETSVSRRSNVSEDDSTFAPISESRTDDDSPARNVPHKTNRPSASKSLKGLFSPARSPHQSENTKRRLTQTPPDDLSSVTKDSAPLRYRIKRGDSLERIALRHYGNRAAVRKIYEANRQQLRSPNDLRPGMTIVLP